MANKEKTLEQLQEELLQAQRAYDIAKKLDDQKKKEEEEKKKAELAAVKEKRYQEIKEAEKKLIELKKAFIEDYGSYYYVSSHDDDGAIGLMRWLFS